MKKNITGLLLCFFALTLRSQSQPYKNLVFEGAGVRGVAYAGAICALEDNQTLSDIEKVGGTSAGAIAALMVSLGYSSTEIEALISAMKLQQFNDGRFLFAGGIARLNKQYGWYRGLAFTRWLEKIIAEKTGNATITFRELHAQHFRDLYVTGISLNRQSLIVFSHETYPDMMIKDAVRISMSIPLYFAAVHIDSNGHVLHRRDFSASADIMVDGGITGNFPIAIFDDQTIGFRIDTPEQLAYDKVQQGLAPVPVYNLKSYMNALYALVIENLNRNTLTDDEWSRTVSISSATIGPKIRRLSLVEKNLLVTNGYMATQEFFRNKK